MSIFCWFLNLKVMWC